MVVGNKPYLLFWGDVAKEVVGLYVVTKTVTAMSKVDHVLQLEWRRRKQDLC